MAHIVYEANGVHAKIHGGPYARRPKGMPGIKMAQELPYQCDVDIPTADFSVPNKRVLTRGMAQAISLMRNHPEVYVGCMGGVGRTGLFMAMMHRLELMIKGASDRTQTGVQAIMYVRKNYNPHAVETAQQEAYVMQFDLKLLKVVSRWL